MATFTTVGFLASCLLSAVCHIAAAHGDHYNVYYLDENCIEYFDEIKGEDTPLTINVRNPESPNPLSTAVIKWSRYRAKQHNKVTNCSLKIAHSAKVPAEKGAYQFKLNGKVGLSGLGSCKDHVEVSVGEFGGWTRVYHSCESTKEDFTFTTKDYQILRVKALVSQLSYGIPFEFVITAVRDKGDDGCGDLLPCKNGLCINNGLKCDHRDNCGDASDEAEEFNCPPMEHDHEEGNENNWLILGLVLGGFFVVFFGIAMAIFLIAGRYGRKDEKKDQQEAEEGEESTTLQVLPNTIKEEADGDTEPDVTTPLQEPPVKTDDVATNVVTYSEPAQSEVEAENPLYESADSSESSNH